VGMTIEARGENGYRRLDEMREGGWDSKLSICQDPRSDDNRWIQCRGGGGGRDKGQRDLVKMSKAITK
jgi:hypothetical protein